MILLLGVPIPDARAQVSVPADTTRADSVTVARRAKARVRPILAPPPLPPAGRPSALVSIADSVLKISTVLDAREVLATSLGLQVLDPGSPNLPAPLFTIVPGRDAAEIRIDGLPVAPARWGETSPLPVPVIAVGEAALRRYSPIQGPLSSTGGPVMDLRLGRIPNGRAASTIRVTRASYGTFTDEISLRRPIGPFLFGGSYGSSKSDGHDLWSQQTGETINVRAGRSLGRWGYGILSYDDGHHREQLLSTKHGTWDQRTVGLRWSRPDSAAGGGIETALEWRHLEVGWRTGLGLTRRDSRTVFARALAQRAVARGTGAIAFEGEVTRTRYDRLNEAHRLLHDIDLGIAIGWNAKAGRWEHRLSAGVARFEPLAPGPVFSVESEVSMGSRSLLLHASRAVRNRTLPRLATDGEAWVRQGIDLVAEENGEAAEALWRAAIEGRGRIGRAARIAIGAEFLLDESGLSLADSEIVLLGTDRQDEIPPAAVRRNRSFATPWSSVAIAFPLGFRISARGLATVAELGTEADLGLPSARGDGQIGWSGAIFKGDFHLDLSLVGRARTKAPTPYGEIGATATVDGEIRGSIEKADFFFVLANLTDEIAPAFGWDGSFVLEPRRHYRAGLRWSFSD